MRSACCSPRFRVLCRDRSIHAAAAVVVPVSVRCYGVLPPCLLSPLLWCVAVVGHCGLLLSCLLWCSIAVCRFGLLLPLLLWCTTIAAAVVIVPAAVIFAPSVVVRCCGVPMYCLLWPVCVGCIGALL